MTNKEAGNVLHTMASLIEFHGVKDEHILTFREAYEMAIKALEERPQGEWLKAKGGYVRCNLCHKAGCFGYHFCPNCGADMRGGRE